MCIDNDFIMKQQVIKWGFTEHDKKWSLDYAHSRNKVSSSYNSLVGTQMLSIWSEYILYCSIYIMQLGTINHLWVQYCNSTKRERKLISLLKALFKVYKEVK